MNLKNVYIIRDTPNHPNCIFVLFLPLDVSINKTEIPVYVGVKYDKVTSKREKKVFPILGLESPVTK